MKQLFEGGVLYCQGRPRTFFRGKLHLLSSLFVFPVVIYYFLTKWQDSYIYKAILLNLLVMFGAHFMSGVYHTFPVSENLEKLWQKMDIIGANLYCGSAFLPMALLFPAEVGQLLAALVLIVTGWNCIDVWNSWYDLSRPTWIVAMHLPFVYYLFTYLSRVEVGLFYLALVSLFIGSRFVIYDNNAYFSKELSFEIYHSFSVPCYIAIFFLNYFILKRTAKI